MSSGGRSCLCWPAAGVQRQVGAAWASSPSAPRLSNIPTAVQGPCSDSAPWCAFQSGFGPHGAQSYDFSHSRITVHNGTHLHWQQYSTTLGRVVDDWWLVQHAHGGWGAAR